MPKEIVETDLSKISALLEQVIGHSDYTDIQRMGGLTNRTYRVSFADGVQYVLRIPGEGTEEMIIRDDEHTSSNLAGCRTAPQAAQLRREYRRTF